MAVDPRERAEIALEVAEAYAALFRWVDAVDVIERALAELGEADEALAAQLEGELVVCGLHDARRASRVAPVLERLSVPARRGKRRRGACGCPGHGDGARRSPGGGGGATARRSAGGCRCASGELGHAGGAALEPDRRGALRDGSAALGPMAGEVRRSGSARGLVAVYSTLGLLDLRLGALPEADAAARVALRVLQEGDFAPGLAFAATVLADIAVEAGELDEAEELLALLPAGGLAGRASAPS